MKGVLFNVIEEVVRTDLGEDAWDEVLVRAGSDGVYTSLGDYPDADLFDIVGAVAVQLGLTVADTLVVCGRRGFAVLTVRHPQVLAPYRSWRDLLAGLNDIVHPEVRKIYAGASVPDFGIADEGDAVLLEYRSAMGLCRLAEGLVIGAGAWLGTPLSVTHRSCTHDGDPVCVLHVADDR